ncbi:MAG: methyltransferase domain-containing protein [Pseudomonadota bacterium]
MNLYDLIKRKDRWLDIQGPVSLAEPRIDGHRQRAIALGSGARIRLKNAHGAFALRRHTFGIMWHVVGIDGDPAIDVDACIENISHPCSRVEPSGTKNLFGIQSPVEMLVKIPDDVGDEFDLQIRCDGGSAMLIVGPLLSMIQRVTEKLKGRGMELGPGLNPQIKPSAKINVSYIEQTPPDEWSRLYNTEIPATLTPKLQSLYRIDSATAPAGIKDKSVDFVFSNHVCEHFANFGQVLLNWAEKLKPGGRFCGVVPDCRFSFDYRQTPTQLEEIIKWQQKGGYDIPVEAYEKWCQNTEPRHNVENLKARGYSIHISYFTPESLSSILQHYCQLGAFSSFSIWCVSNGRDIGFSVQR